MRRLELKKKEENEGSIHTKLPKLIITKFKGVPTNGNGSVTKFSNLRQLAECILRYVWKGEKSAKYSKDSEIVIAYSTLKIYCHCPLFGRLLKS